MRNFKSALTEKFAFATTLLLLSTSIAGAKNLIVNNGFEDTVVSNPKSYLRFVPGQSIGGWSVTGDAVDVHGAEHTEPKTGNQSLDLAGGDLAGGIYQYVPTQVGQRYLVSFWVAGHPWHTDIQPEKRFELWFGNQSTGILKVKRAQSMSKMNWQFQKFYFVAAEAWTPVWFVGHTKNGGAILDSVSVVQSQ